MPVFMSYQGTENPFSQLKHEQLIDLFINPVSSLRASLLPVLSCFGAFFSHIANILAWFQTSQEHPTEISKTR